jgi:two-component system sensor histidine kinase PhoQ
MSDEKRIVAPQPAASPARPASLRARLLLLGLMVLAVALGLVGLALDAAFSRSAEAELHRQMETWAYLALGATEVSGTGSLMVPGDLGDPRLTQPGSGIYVHVHGPQDHWSSPSALGLELPELTPVPAGQQSFRKIPGAPGYLVYQSGAGWELPDASVLPLTVSVLVDPVLLEPRTQAFRSGLWRSLGAAGLILALAQFLFLWLALRPLRRMAGDVAAIEAGARESLGGLYPAELEPLTRNLDRLLKTEKANQERYRSALDSLAHSLKTPLAVIHAGLPKSQGPEVAAMQEAVDDMQHLITSRLQRAAASTRRTHAAPVAVLPLVERLLASLRKVYSHKLKTVDVSIDSALRFQGEKRDLMELMGNLLDNACKYGQGMVKVAAGREGGALWLRVENDGRPISSGQAQQLLQRGVRGDERERIEGHGLGLTIVMELVNAYGGQLDIEQSELGGAAMTVRFPAG